MALKLGLCFPGVVFPVAIAVLAIFILMTGLGEPGAGSGAPLDRPRLTAAEKVPD